MTNTNQYTSMLHRVPRTTASNGWELRHASAIQTPKSWEFPIVTMLHGWLAQAESYENDYHSKIGDDSVLGPAWEAIGDSLRTLLNGNCGRLDGGTLDNVILDAMRMAGVDTGDK